MKFGIRECANVVFRAKQNMKIGNYEFKMGQPVLYIDSATTSSVEQASTTVYAQGGRGNVRLIAWEGEKTLTFTVEDALLSPISLAMLSGADLFKGVAGTSPEKVHFHTTSRASSSIAAGTETYYTYAYSTDHYVSSSVSVTAGSVILDLSSVLGDTETICKTNDAPIYVIVTENDGSLTGGMIEGTVKVLGKTAITGETTTVEPNSQVIVIESPKIGTTTVTAPASYYVDFYLDKDAAQVDELQIAADNFAGSYYVEADTLWRSQADGIDYPANLTFPNVKIQSNFTFSLSATGDPSTFTFTMDAFPGYTYFDKSRQVLCVIQVVNDATSATKKINPVMPHNKTAEHALNDSNYLGYAANTTVGTRYSAEQWTEINETPGSTVVG